MINPENHDKDTNFIMKNNRSLRVRVRVRFLLFYSEPTPTDEPLRSLLKAVCTPDSFHLLETF